MKIVLFPIAPPLLLILAIASALAAFPEPVNSEKVAGEPMPAAEAAAKVQLPDGFAMNVFAAEPMVRNPIAMAWDTRGRLWIAENYTYAERPIKMDSRYRDRILVLEDTDHDGDADKSTVFADDLQGLMSIETGANGIWAIALPRVLFIPDQNGDDRPDGPAQTVLDGFPMPDENHHNCANGLRWGPDGWLYGRCGASGPAMAGKPGTPQGERIPVHGGVWRYQPHTGAFDTLCSGTTNPWGMDWNAEGELFFSNTVNGHLWHVIPGAHYARPHTLDPNPLTYHLIDQHADHYHFDTGKGWGNSRDGKANEFGGGHAHCGLMIYQGASWPAEYRNKIYMLNFHGRRINCDLPERSGTGYIVKHGTDMALMADPFFRGIDLSSGPDGAVYVLDYSDTGECHEATGVHRNSGRVFRISHRDATPPRRKSWRGAPGLFAHVSEKDEWHVRAARQELIKRFLEGEPLEHDRAVLEDSLNGDSPAAVRLRSLWALHATGGIPEEKLLRLLIDPVDSIRTWAVRLLVDAQPLDTPMNRIRATALAEKRFTALKKCAAEDTSGLVRLTLASALQRLPAEQRLDLAKVLTARAEDAGDHNLPAMFWYALMPLAQSHPQDLASLAAASRQPLTRQCIARSLAAQIDTQASAVDAMLKGATSDPAALNDITEGMALALKGRRKAPAPASWKSVTAAAAATPQVAARVRELSVVFGDGRALEEIRALVLDKSADIRIRKNALTSFIEAKPEDLRAVCEAALKERFLNAVAVTGLTGFDDPALGKKIAASYGSFHPVDRPALISALASRPAFALALLDAIAAGAIARTELSAFDARRIAAFKDAALTEKLKAVWGSIREGTAERAAFRAKLKSSLTKESLAAADLKSGRTLYTSLCANCHTLYGEGGKIGPDLTGSQRHDLDYLLENIVDPGAVVTADFKMSLVHLKDGSTASGIITARTDKSVSINEPTGPRTFDAANIASIETSAESIMPAGVLEVLPADQVKSLLAYLMHPSQVTP